MSKPNDRAARIALAKRIRRAVRDAAWDAYDHGRYDERMHSLGTDGVGKNIVSDKYGPRPVTRRKAAKTCPHPSVRHVSDPSGGGDSCYVCQLCFGELPRPNQRRRAQ